ncbi:MAG: hypothetical protein AAFR84_04875 [Pseudomonadota bacterium]
MMPIRLAAIAAVPFLFLMLAPPPAAADQEGYYYPEVASEETFSRQIAPAPQQPSRNVRVAFITQITKAQLDAPETPRFAIFAKGAEAEHMIIVALDDEVFSTLFRARAVLAQLTSNARGTDFFRNAGIETTATWFDLAKLLGFEDLVISDGSSWAHRVRFEAAE